MIDTLHLTAQEQWIFDGLKDDLKEGWKTESERLSYVDGPHHRRIRMQNAHIADPRLKEVREKMRDDSTIYDVSALIGGLDLKNLNDRDVRELLYALGPDVLGGMIALMLKQATNDNDVREAAAYSVARHLFFAQP